MGAGASMISDDVGKLAVSRNTNPVATSYFDTNYQRERAELRKKLIQTFQSDPQYQTLNKQISVVRSLLVQYPELCATAARESEVELDLLPTNFIAAHYELDRLLTLYETNIILKSAFCRLGTVACPLGHHAAFVENMRPLSTKDNPLKCNICTKVVQTGYHCSYCCYNLCQPCSDIYCCNGHAMKLWTHPESEHHCVVCNNYPITSGYRCVECEKQHHNDYNICDMCTYIDGRKKVQQIILDRLGLDLNYLESHMTESAIALKTISTHRKKMEDNSYSTTKELYDFTMSIHRIQEIAVKEVQQTRITRVIQRLRNKLFMGKDICLTAKNEYEHNLIPINNNNYTIQELIRLLSLEDWSDHRKSLRMRNNAFIACPLNHAMTLYSVRPLPYRVKANPAALRGIESKISQGIVDIRYEDIIILDVEWEAVQSAIANVIMHCKNYLSTPISDIEAEEEKNQRDAALLANNNNNQHEKYDDEVLNHWIGMNTIYNHHGNFLVLQQQNIHTNHNNTNISVSNSNNSYNSMKRRKNDVVLTMLETLMNDMKRLHDEKKQKEREEKERLERLARGEEEPDLSIYGEEDEFFDDLNMNNTNKKNKKQYRKREVVKKKNKTKKNKIHPIDGVSEVSETTSITSGTESNHGGGGGDNDDQNNNNINNNNENNGNDGNGNDDDVDDGNLGMDILTVIDKSQPQNFTIYKQSMPPPKCAVCSRVAAPRGCYCDFCDYALCSLCSVVYCFDGHAMKMWTEPMGSLESCFLCKKEKLTSGYRCSLCHVDLCDLCTTKTARGKVRKDWEKEMHTLIDYMKSMKHHSDIAKYYEWRSLNQIISTGQLVDYVHELRTAKIRVEKQVQQKGIIDKIKIVRNEVIKRADLCKAAARESIRNEAFVYASKTQAMQELKRLVALLKAMMVAQTQEYRSRAGIACPLGHGMIPIYKKNKAITNNTTDTGEVSFYIHEYEGDDSDEENMSVSSQHKFDRHWRKEGENIQFVNDNRSLQYEHGSVVTDGGGGQSHTIGTVDEDFDDEEGDELEAEEIVHELLHGTTTNATNTNTTTKKKQKKTKKNTSTTTLPSITNNTSNKEKDRHQPIGEAQQQIFQPLKSTRQQLDNLLSDALQPPKAMYHQYDNDNNNNGSGKSSGAGAAAAAGGGLSSPSKSNKFTVPAHNHLAVDISSKEDIALQQQQQQSVTNFSFIHHQQKQKRSCQVCGCKITAAMRAAMHTNALSSSPASTGGMTNMLTPSKKYANAMDLQPPIVPLPEVPYTCPICEYDLCPDCCILYCRKGHALRIWTLQDAHHLVCDLCKQSQLTSGYRCVTCETDICDLCTTRDSRNAFLLWPRRELHKILTRFDEVKELSTTARDYLRQLMERHPDRKYLESISKLWIELNIAKKIKDVVELEAQVAQDEKDRQHLMQTRQVGFGSKSNLKSLLPANNPFFNNIASLLDDPMQSYMGTTNNTSGKMVESVSLPSLSKKL